MARVIGVVSGKGGVGKTVVSINLAAALQKYYNRKILLIDANVTTPHLGLYLGLYSTPVTLNDVIRGTVSTDEAVYEHSSGLHIMPSSLRIEDMKDIDWRDFREKISSVFGNYDVVIVDSSPGFNREALLTLGMCNETLFVTNPIVHSAADLIKCKDITKDLNIKPLGIALNMVRNKKYEISRKEVEELVEMNVLCSIKYDDKIMESIVKKKPAIEISKGMNNEIIKAAGYIAGEKPKGERRNDMLFRILGLSAKSRVIRF